MAHTEPSPGLSPTLRTGVTLAVLALLLVLGAAWGWSALTEPLPKAGAEPTGPCVETEVTAGSRVGPRQVLVSVLNAGTQEGLAGRTMKQLTQAGFGEGVSGNAPDGTEVRRAQVWAADVDSPAVRLVASRLPGAEVVERRTTEPGVVVVVGDRFRKLDRGRRTVRVVEDTTICSPVPPS